MLQRKWRCFSLPVNYTQQAENIDFLGTFQVLLRFLAKQHVTHERSYVTHSNPVKYSGSTTACTRQDRNMLHDLLQGDKMNGPYNYRTLLLPRSMRQRAWIHEGKRGS